MMMLGGSPMRVAVPPMFDAMTCEMRNGTGDVPRRCATKNVIGVSNTTVVTLSRKALTTAVITLVNRRRRYGWPSARRTASTAIHWKMPVFAITFAMIIIPASRKITLKSTKANASR